MKQNPQTLRAMHRGASREKKRLSRKGLFSRWGFWEPFPTGRTATPPHLRPPAIPEALLCICFPVTNSTARHNGDCHMGHPKQLLNTSKSRA